MINTVQLEGSAVLEVGEKFSQSPSKKVMQRTLLGYSSASLILCIKCTGNKLEELQIPAPQSRTLLK